MLEHEDMFFSLTISVVLGSKVAFDSVDCVVLWLRFSLKECIYIFIYVYWFLHTKSVEHLDLGWRLNPQK